MPKVVLLCDMEPGLSKLYESYLNNSDIQILQCQQPDHVQHLAISAQPDLLMLNTQMGDSSGFKLCRHLKQNELTLMTPVILLNNTPSPEQRRLAADVGAIDLIPRVPSPFFFKERIEAVLYRNQNTQLINRLPETRYQILIAEDSQSLQRFYATTLAQIHCDVTLCSNGQTAWQALKQNDHFDLIITDLYMPVMSGHELCSLIRASYEFDHIPIVVITTEREKPALYDLLNQGVNDFIQKPFSEMELTARVQAHLRQRQHLKEQSRLSQELIELSATLEDHIMARTQDIYNANVETLYKLATACDLKDTDTADHIARVKDYVETFSLSLGLEPELSKQYGYCSMMHDVGKLGIPDAILCKPGPLSLEEWEIMRTHPEKGKQLLGDQPFFKHAADIAIGHHERFDGSGYPFGIPGRQIPLSARIVAIVDIYDALTSRRPYKAPWKEEDALKELQRLSGNHLDPYLVSRFLKLSQNDQLKTIHQRYSHV